MAKRRPKPREVFNKSTSDLNPIILLGTTAFAILGGGVLAHLFGRKKQVVPQQPAAIPQPQTLVPSSQGYWLRGTEYVDDNVVYKDGSSQPYLVRKRDGFWVPQPRTQEELLSAYSRPDWVRRTNRRDGIVIPENWWVDISNKYEYLTPEQLEVVRKAKDMGFVDDVLYPHRTGERIYVFLYKNYQKQFVGIEFNDNGKMSVMEGYMKSPSGPKEKRRGIIENYIIEEPDSDYNQGKILEYLNNLAM